MKFLFPSLLIILNMNLSFADSTSSPIDKGSCTDAQKNLVVTTHTTTIAGKQISYTATAGFIEVVAADQSSKACIFYTAYDAQGITDPSARPIIFAFNGGPGSASLWLHMGALGPKRVDMGPDGLTSSDPFKIVTNDSSPLDISDIVIIDPVATGFSHSENGSSDSAFFGAKNDYQSIAVFIQNYLGQTNRWLSRKYIMGESYGGVRASLLARHLQADMSISVDGVIFVSPMLSTTPLNFGETYDNNVPYWTYFPSFAATAWYHNKIASKYQTLAVADVFAQAKAFAETELRDALDNGNSMSIQALQSVAQKVADFIGIPEQTVEDLNLRVADTDFFSGLYNKEQIEIGRFDSRFTGPRLPGQNGTNATDPSDSATDYPFTAAMNSYLRSDLGFQTASPYEVSANIPSWPFGADGEEFSVTGDLAQAMSDNTNLRVFIASGFYDLACPMGTVEYELSQLASPKQNLLARVSTDHFESGHMVYINPVSLIQLKADLVHFIQKN